MASGCQLDSFLQTACYIAIPMTSQPIGAKHPRLVVLIALRIAVALEIFMIETGIEWCCIMSCPSGQRLGPPSIAATLGTIQLLKVVQCA